jgi:hypothetical protein
VRELEPTASNDNEVTKRDYIVTFFDEARDRANLLLDLHRKNYRSEALTLCLVYIDSFSQWLFWPRDQSGRNFVGALVEFGRDSDYGLLHPLAVVRTFAEMKPQWKDFGARVQTLFPGPRYSLFEKSEFLKRFTDAFSRKELKLVEAELWRGTIANIAYSRLRNPSVHKFGRNREISFDNTTFQGTPARNLTFERLHCGLLGLIDEARRRSLVNNQWFGDDKILKVA